MSFGLAAGRRIVYSQRRIRTALNFRAASGIPAYREISSGLKASTLVRTVHDAVAHPPEFLVIRICRLLHNDVH
jgi:hypothetical protein